MDIYGTIGPACADRRLLTEMFCLGMTGIRLNLSHTELADCREWTDSIRKAGEAAGVSPRLLIDLQGPELRIGVWKEPLELTEGNTILLKSIGHEKNAVPVPEQVFAALKPGQEILLDDGKLLLTVMEISKDQAVCQIKRGGVLTSRKSIALPGVRLELPTLTESDRKNLQEAHEHGVTGVMLPFVREARDLKNLKRELCEANVPGLEIFAKLENMEGVRNLESLLPYADHIVIARGDLGNSMPLWELPAVQAEIARKCKRAGKPFMVVTQMLASMEEHPVPTRAEVSDIFRAVSEGAASVMVTGETAAGKYPAEVIRYLCRTAESARRYLEKC